MLWYFIPRVLKLAKAKMSALNGYSGDAKTVNWQGRAFPPTCFVAVFILLLLQLCGPLMSRLLSPQTEQICLVCCPGAGAPASLAPSSYACHSWA